MTRLLPVLAEGMESPPAISSSAFDEVFRQEHQQGNSYAISKWSVDIQLGDVDSERQLSCEICKAKSTSKDRQPIFWTKPGPGHMKIGQAEVLVLPVHMPLAQMFIFARAVTETGVQMAACWYHTVRTLTQKTAGVHKHLSSEESCPSGSFREIWR